MEGFPGLFRIVQGPNEVPTPIPEHCFVFIDALDSMRFKCKNSDESVEYLLTSDGQFITCDNPIT